VIRERIKRLQQLLVRVAVAPAEWTSKEAAASAASTRLEPMRCRSWQELEGEWRQPHVMRWRQAMSDVFSTMLSVAASTSQKGNQICLMVIGDPGGGKSQLCDSMLVSRNCYQLEHFTGFHSGMKGEGGQDLSLLTRINHKTLITSEGDVLMSSPLFGELMSQMRRIYDGTSSAVYKNTDEDKNHVGLRTPWIIAGTGAVLDHDQSRVGDRFLRIFLDQPPADERRNIVLTAMRSERAAVRERSTGAGGGIESRLMRAYAMTGGYVDWLRENIEEQIAHVDSSDEAVNHLYDLACLVADMRARPQLDVKKVDVHDAKELPTRIGRQLVRLSECLAVVMNKPLVDGEVLRRCRKVALDSARGKSLDLVSWFFAIEPRSGKTYQQGSGHLLSTLVRWAGMPEDRMAAYLAFLAKIGVVEHRSQVNSHGHWKLTERTEQLYINTCT
jgi:hypothetical protein